MRIELHDVRRRFGRVPALSGVSLTIAAGERVALVGPNGSGKSTLIRAMLGLIRCDGSVRIDGRDPFVELTVLAARMAYVPQTAPQLGATVSEVVRAVAVLRRTEAGALSPWAAALGLDVANIGDRPVRALSGGMKQKLLLALALAAPASLYILDEPTASLDARTREVFFARFRERTPGATVVLSSHRVDEVQRLVDRVVALDSGRIVFDGAVTMPVVADNLSVWWPASPAPLEPTGVGAGEGRS